MKKAFLVLSILAGAAVGARAGLILSDDFTYPTGGIVSNSTWFQNTGTAGTMLVSNNTLIVSGLRTEDIAHTLTGFPYATNGAVSALYSSYKLKSELLPSQPGNYFSHFSGTNAFGTLSGFRARVFASTTNFAGVAGPGQFFISIVNNGLGNTTNGEWATPLDTNVTYTIVTRYVLGTGISTLWVNPNAETDPSVTPSDP